MGRRFKKTTDFQFRYDNFIQAMGYINDKYTPFFDLKEAKTGNMDCIEMHIAVNTSDSTNMVTINFNPRSYLHPLIKEDVLRIFSEYFKN